MSNLSEQDYENNFDQSEYEIDRREEDGWNNNIDEEYEAGMQAIATNGARNKFQNKDNSDMSDMDPEFISDNDDVQKSVTISRQSDDNDLAPKQSYWIQNNELIENMYCLDYNNRYPIHFIMGDYFISQLQSLGIIQDYKNIQNIEIEGLCQMLAQIICEALNFSISKYIQEEYPRINNIDEFSFGGQSQTNKL